MGLLGFARTVDDATDHGHVHRHQQVLQAPFQLVHGLHHVEVLPRTARAGDEVDATGAQVQGLEDVETDLDLLDRIGSQGNPDGVADSLGQEHAQPHRRLHRAGAQAAGLGDAQVQGLLDLPGQQAIGGDGHEDVGGLDADLEVLEVQLVEMIDVAHGRFEQGFRGRFAVFLLQVLFQRTGIDADTDRDVALARGLDPVLATDVARIDAQAVHSQLGDAQGDAIVEVDVGDQRHVDLLLDLAERLGGVHVGDGNPHDVRTGIFQAADLRDGGSDVAGLGVGHALHGDRRIAAHRDVADPDFPRLAANDRRSAMNAHCPTFRRAVSPRTKGVTSTGWPL